MRRALVFAVLGRLTILGGLLAVTLGSHPGQALQALGEIMPAVCTLTAVTVGLYLGRPGRR